MKRYIYVSTRAMTSQLFISQRLESVRLPLKPVGNNASTSSPFDAAGLFDIFFCVKAKTGSKYQHFYRKSTTH